MTKSIYERLQYRLTSIPRTPSVADRSLLMLGALRDIGWARSVAEGRPVDEQGAPIPWWTYAAIHFIDRALDGTQVVFEYGSGQSTRWLATRAQTVHSIEHDEEWYLRASTDLSANIQLHHRRCSGDRLVAPADDPYVRSLDDVRDPDVIIIDGRARLSCIDIACKAAPGDGLIVLDDSHRPAYAPGLEQLARAGFARLDFVGPVPGRTGFSTTSVFSRDLHQWAQPIAAPFDWDSLR